jgi:opacity protein-like surface antigen
MSPLGWTSLLGAGLSLAAGLAYADPVPITPGWTIAVDVGGHAPETMTSHSVGLAPDNRPYDWRWRLNDDWGVFLRGGYRLNRRFRLELELGQRQSRLNQVEAPGGIALDGSSIARPLEPSGLCSLQSGPSPACNRPTGRANIFTGMLNGIVDILPERRIDPFVGVGIGLTHIQFHGTYRFRNTPGLPGPQDLQLGGTLARADQLSGQLIGGVSLRATRKVNVDLTYRYLFAPYLKWETLNKTPGGGTLDPGAIHGRLRDSTLTLGMRYAF